MYDDGELLYILGWFCLVVFKVDCFMVFFVIGGELVLRYDSVVGVGSDMLLEIFLG